MKKAIAILAVGVSLALHADYLYWMVNTESASAFDYDTVLIKSSSQIAESKTSYLDIYTEVSNAAVTEYQAGGDYFIYSGDLNSTDSFYVELYNGDRWLAKSSPIDYATLLNNHSIFTGGFQPATISPTSFGSYAVPEPTSGLLFLVGGMLLGLKRRRQKV